MGKERWFQIGVVALGMLPPALLILFLIFAK